MRKKKYLGARTQTPSVQTQAAEAAAAVARTVVVAVVRSRVEDEATPSNHELGVSVPQRPMKS